MPAVALTADAVGIITADDWNDIPAPAVDAAIGDEWIGQARSLALIVPSVHIPLATPERNVLLHPLHPHFTKIHYTIDELTYDRRLLAARRAHTLPRKHRALRVAARDHAGAPVERNAFEGDTVGAFEDVRV